MQIDKDKENDKDKDKKYIDKAFNDERLTLSVSAHEKSPGAEKDFLEEVKAALEAWGPERAEAKLTGEPPGMARRPRRSVGCPAGIVVPPASNGCRSRCSSW